jgi:hypothetical protein
MIKTLKKLTINKEKLPNDLKRKIIGKGPFCAVVCDNTCGTKIGNDGAHYSSQRSWIEDPIF